MGLGIGVSGLECGGGSLVWGRFGVKMFGILKVPFWLSS